MTETIKVIINPDGISCKERNPLGRFANYVELNISEDQQSRQIKAWREAESKIRTFQIEGTGMGWSFPRGEPVRFTFKPGSIHTAQILDNGKVKIVE